MRLWTCHKTNYLLLLLLLMMTMMIMICSITTAYLLSHVFREASIQSSTSALGRMNGMMSSSVASATRPSPDTNSSIHWEYPNPVCKTHDTSCSNDSREGDVCVCVCMYVCKNVCMYCVCVCMYVFMYVYVCMYVCVLFTYLFIYCSFVLWFK
jgi:hypothetical protein